MLAFEKSSHTYRWNGARAPSVTQLLDKLHSFAGVPEDVLEAARQRGTAVHRACHFFDENDLDETQLKPAVAGYLDGWKKFRSDHAVEIVECEQSGFHAVHRYAGTWDRVLRVAGDQWTADIKTGPPHWVMGLQTAAYERLRHPVGVPPRSKRATVHLRPDGTYHLRQWTDPSDWPAFVSLVTLHNIAEKHRGSV